MTQYSHLHCHTQYSLLDGAANIEKLLAKAHIAGMKSLAITDHGNMFGIPKFVFTAQKYGIKPIIGCEFYLTDDMHDKNSKQRYHQILLAKDEIGYKNLIKLSSLSFLEGYYYKPRIDKKLIKQYSQGLIATTSCLSGQVPTAILKDGEEKAEKIFLEWLDIFGDDYYIELQRHGINEQAICNKVLIEWSKKHKVKVIATNDVHYIEENDNIAQDIILCLQTGKKYDDPDRMRFANNQFFLKSPQDMYSLFNDIPQAIDNTLEIEDKVKAFSLERDVLMPIYKVPNNFESQEAYLKHLALTSVKTKYNEVDETIQERINYELGIINKSGFAGYMLIVQDFINAAKELDVVVGPGRGSVVGSLVAYCLGITNIDPLKYNLLFERFLNPERISLPDIDIDFDDEGRMRVIDYVVNKYGKDQVAHIITFGSMAAKSSIRDVARVLGIPIEKADYLAKLVPEKPGTTLAKAFEEVPELNQIKEQINSDESKILQLAETLEGSPRHTGIHAAGVIISKDDLKNYIPVKTDKDTNLLTTQYDGAFIEKMGMLKMDFLGLKTLSIIKDTIKLIKENYNITLDLDNIPIDDTQTFELFQEGKTISVFQFESVGMRQCLIDLKPSTIEDLIAMNSLYRPGPMQFIPNFINRKHGKEKIEYPHPLLEGVLKNTYGIIVYQEQVMQVAQEIAGYTLGQADILRKAMGKKNQEEMAKQKEIFIKGAQEKHNIPTAKSKEIFDLVAKFAQYGFNRSHSAAYAMIAYQTAYLKTHYTAEYMCSVLKHNQNDINKLAFFMKECQDQSIKILSPDINESQKDFSVTPAKQIRFGLSAIKGTGNAAVETIIAEREKTGNFKTILDFVERVNSKKVTKKTIESLAMGGAFDKIETYHRKQYIENNKTGNFIEKLIQYAQQINKEKANAQQSLFCNSEITYISKPEPENCEPYSKIEQLLIEKETIGFYISGHPLEKFELEIKHLCNATSKNILTFKNKEVNIAGMVTNVQIKKTKTGQEFGIFTIEDYEGSITMSLFQENFLKFKHLLYNGSFLYMTAQIVERYGKSELWEPRPSKIEPLENIIDKLVKSIELNLQASEINQQSIKHLEETIIKNKGKCELIINLIDQDEEIVVNTFSRKHKIRPSLEFIKSLIKIDNLGYQLNRI
jgi:DNA polymerase-3 subunit alpha